MKGTKRNIVVAVTGASGAIYAQLLLNKLEALKSQWQQCAVVFSANAKDIWTSELDCAPALAKIFTEYEINDFSAAFASGSSLFDTLIVCPCSMGTLGRVAGGVSNDLITRTADVMLKEKRKLILVPRETPYNLIHIKNMKTIIKAGGIICPATPSFYSKPKTIEELALTVVDRVLDNAGFELTSFRYNTNTKQ